MNFKNWLATILFGLIVFVFSIGFQYCILHFNWADDQDYGFLIALVIGSFLTYVLWGPFLRHCFKVRNDQPRQSP